MKQRWLAGVYELQNVITVPGSVYAIRFDEEKVVCGTQDAHIRVFDRRTWKNTLTLLGHRDWIGAIQYDDEKVRSAYAFFNIVIFLMMEKIVTSW